jgi:N-acetylneuraminic acid mutarotase
MRFTALGAAAAAGILLSSCARDDAEQLTARYPQAAREILAQPGLARSGGYLTFWTTVGRLATGRSAHTATRLPSGKVIVAGGIGTGGSALASSELYDPASRTWSTARALAMARHSHTATLLDSGKVLVVGGLDDSGVSLPSAELYDPATDAWEPARPLAAARDHHTATLLPSGKLLVAGGFSTSDVRRALDSGEVFDPAAGTWSQARLTTSREGHTATLLPSGSVLVTGGWGSADNVELDGAEVYDPATGNWSPTGSLTDAREGHTATLLPSGKVLVAGGYFSSGGHLDSAEVYDPATALWSPTGKLSAARTGFTATLLASGKVLVAGGGSVNTHYDVVELYDPAVGAFGVTEPLETPRSGHTATLLASGKVLLAGGYDGTSYLFSAEEYEAAPPVVISPASASVPPRGSTTLTASGGSGTAFAWTLATNASGGEIDANGIYTAGPTGGVTDVVQVVDSIGTVGQASVAVGPGVGVTPATVTMVVGGTKAFTASGGQPPYLWSFAQNASRGSIDGASGNYRTGTGTGPDIVQATDSLGNVGTAQVTVIGGAKEGCGSVGADAPALAAVAMAAAASRWLRARRRRED